MESIVIKLLDNWHWVVILFFVGQFIKIVSNAFLRVYEIRSSNKDILKLAVSNDRVELHIESSHLKIDDLKKLKDQKVLEFKKSA